MKQISQLNKKNININENDRFVIDDANDGYKTKYVTADDIKSFCVPDVSIVSITITGNSVLKTYSNGFKEQMGKVRTSSTVISGSLGTQIEDPTYASITPTWASTGDDNDFGFGCSASKNLLSYQIFSRFNINGAPCGFYWYVCGF